MENQNYPSKTAEARELKGKTSYRLDALDWELIKELDDNERLNYFESIVQFVLQDAQPNMKTVGGAMASLAIRKIEADNRKWLEKCQKNQRIKRNADEQRRQAQTNTDDPFAIFQPPNEH